MIRVLRSRAASVIPASGTSDEVVSANLVFSSYSMHAASPELLIVAPEDLRRELFSTVQLPQGFYDGRAVNGDGAAAFALVDIRISVWQLLNVAVEVDSYNLAGAVDHRTSGVAPYRIRGVGKVEGSRQVEQVP